MAVVRERRKRKKTTSQPRGQANSFGVSLLFFAVLLQKSLPARGVAKNRLPNFSLTLYTTHMKTPRLTLVLFVASLAAIAIDAGRGGILLASGLGYLVWNLFLAWIPYLITSYCITKNTSFLRFIPFFVVWLLFFPNAPYLVTDLIHLVTHANHILWYDALIFFFFGWIGLLIGILSLIEIRAYFRAHLSAFVSELAVLCICALSSFGIYLGRFERWNIVTHPSQLLSHSYAISTSLGHTGTPLTFVGVFTVFIYTVYVTIAAVLNAKEQLVSPI